MFVFFGFLKAARFHLWCDRRCFSLTISLGFHLSFGWLTTFSVHKVLQCACFWPCHFEKLTFFFLSFRFYFCCASRFRRVVKVLLLKTFLRRQHLCDGVFYSFFAQILCSCMCHNLISYFGWKTCFCAFHQNARQNTLSQGLSSLQNF